MIYLIQARKDIINIDTGESKKTPWKDEMVIESKCFRNAIDWVQEYFGPKTQNGSPKRCFRLQRLHNIGKYKDLPYREIDALA